MFVIHVPDIPTHPATLLYKFKGAKVISSLNNPDSIQQLLNLLPVGERVILIGRGDCHGIRRHGVYRYGTHPKRNPVILGNEFGEALRRHNGYLIGLWPHAAEFARRNRLKGLFTDIFFYDSHDAESYGMITLTDHILPINELLFEGLNEMLQTHTPLYRIAERMKELPRTRYPKAWWLLRNFESFFCF